MSEEKKGVFEGIPYDVLKELGTHIKIRGEIESSGLIIVGKNRQATLKIPAHLRNLLELDENVRVLINTKTGNPKSFTVKIIGGDNGNLEGV